MAQSNELEPPKALRLLCLDGGGVRGLSELLMLEAIMRRVQTLLHLQETPRPAEYFDLIGGTSTGGLIAIMLGRLRMTVREAIDSYCHLSQVIFGKKQARFRSSKYSSKNFESVVKTLVASKLGGDEDAKMREEEDPSCKSFVCSVCTKNVPLTRLFRSYEAPDLIEDDCRIWEAARATCAAPTYFDRISIGPEGRKEDFIDGGVGCNNPINELHKEAGRLFDSSRPVACVISLGTGERNVIQVERSNLIGEALLPINLINGFKKLALDSGRIAEEMDQKYAQIDGLYFRLSVAQGLQKIGLADWDKLSDVQTHTLKYLKSAGVAAKIGEMAFAISGVDKPEPRPVYTLGHLSMSNETVIQSARASLQASQSNPVTDPMLTTKKELKDLLNTWLIPPGLLTTSAAQDQEDRLEKRFRNPEGTYSSCDWCFETEEYQGFSSPATSSLLWVKGRPGCGKSVLFSSIIDRLENPPSTTKSWSLLYHYGHRDPMPTTSMAIVRSLIAQTLEWENRSIMPEIDRFRSSYPVLRDHDRNIEIELWNLLRTILAFDEEKVYIIVDGLEECAQSLLRPLISLTNKRDATRQMSLLLSSRFDSRYAFDTPNIQKLLSRSGLEVRQLDVTPERTCKDLAGFVAHRVNDKDSAFQRKSQITRDEVIGKVCERAGGMFLYASLVLDELKGDKIASPAAINKTLKNLPTGLNELYDLNLEIPRRSIKGPEVFRWIFCATRTLSWAELKSGLAIVGLEYSPDDIIEDSCEEFVEHSCGQLVEAFGEMEDNLRFIHPTVKDFLVESGGPGLELGIPKAHSILSSKLLTFLMYPDLPEFSPSVGEVPRTIIEKYSGRPGRGLYSYAMFNWYRHLKECGKSADPEIEGQVLKFLLSAASLRWLKGAMVLSNSAKDGTDSVSLAVDVIGSLEGWVQGKSWAGGPNVATKVEQWIKDFLDLMLDWGKVLESQPYWIHYIHHQFISEGSHFRQMLEGSSGQNIIQFHGSRVQTKSSEKPTWPDRCFAVDQERDLAYTFDDPFISCYHMRTGLMIADVELNFSTMPVNLSLKKGLLCPQKRFLAAVFEAVGPDMNPYELKIRKGLKLTFQDARGNPLAWRLENEFDFDWTAIVAPVMDVDKSTFIICLLELQHTGLPRTDLFKLPNFQASPIISTVEQIPLWELDDPDVLTFSPDSTLLSMPSGILNILSGRITTRWSFVLDPFQSCGRVTADFETRAAVLNRNKIELCDMYTNAVRREFSLPGITHLLALSDRGRFFLILRVQTYGEPQPALKKPPFNGFPSSPFVLLPQKGTIGVFDCKNEGWTPLVVLEPPLSRMLAPWQISSSRLWPNFSPEVQGVHGSNKVLIQIPSGWNIAESIRQSGSTNPSTIPREAHLLVFEADRLGDGFGPSTTLKVQVPMNYIRQHRIDISNPGPNIFFWSPNRDLETRPLDRRIGTIKKTGFVLATNECVASSPSLQKSDSVKLSKRTCVLMISPDRSIAYQIQVSIGTLKKHDQRPTRLLKSKLSSPEYDSKYYNVLVTYIRAGELCPTYLHGIHKTSSGTYYQPAETQYISATDDGRVAFGSIEIELCNERDESTLAMKDPAKTIFQQALGSFKRLAHPLRAPRIRSMMAAFIEADTTAHYAIFENAEVTFRREGDKVDLGKGESGPFSVNAAHTCQGTRHIFQFARRLGTIDPGEIPKEASQFEIFLCAYDENIASLNWVMHTLTAGETSPSEAEFPETAWALHPRLPLLIWLLPGHKLKVSHIESHRPPIIIGESLTLEVDPTQAFRFSATGRYLLIQARNAFKNDFVNERKYENVRTIMLYNLVTGTTIELTLPKISSMSIDLDDEHLKIYRLTGNGAIEMNLYSLPDLVSLERQYLTFLPANCRCATCGEPYETSCHILVIEHQGIKSIVLGHSPVNIGRASANNEACEPLILRVLSPSIPVDEVGMHDTLVTARATRMFPPVLDDKGDILDESFNEPQESPGSEPNDVPKDSLQPPRRKMKMQPMISNFEDNDGNILLPEEIEGRLRRDEREVIEALTFGEEYKSDSLGSLKRVVGEDYFPFDSTAEYLEAMADLGPEFNIQENLRKFFGTDQVGIGCNIPLPVHTFYYPNPAPEGKHNFYWSSAFDIGWIQESIVWYYERFFKDDFVDARKWYEFPLYENFVKSFDAPEAKEKREKAIKKIGGMMWRIPKAESRRRMLENSKRDGAVLKDDDDGDDEPTLALKDMVSAMSDILPGMGKLFEERVRQMMELSMIPDAEE